MNHKKDASNPFNTLLHDSLNVSAGEELVLVHDETLAPFWDDLLDAVCQSDCSPTFIKLPVALQHKLAEAAPAHEDVRIPLSVQAAIDEADVVVTLLSGDVNLASVRRAIVSKAIGQNRPGNRFAHIPGISHEILDVLTRSPIGQIERDCEAVAWALGEGRSASLRTFDSEGREHRLTCDLGGWHNEPLISPGVIYPDSWGNLPPGETFCCPSPRSVNGTVVVNGSIPDYVCEAGEQVILEFIDGRLTNWRSQAPSLINFFDRQRDLAVEHSDRDWNTFAELGVGLNPAIDRLTGNSLFDEKAHGTVHIAIGDNFAFGHTVRSRIHVDLVITRPSLVVDDHLVIDKGTLRTDVLYEWRAQLAVLPVNLTPLFRVQLRRERFETKPRRTDVFARRLHSRGRTGYVNIAFDAEAHRLRTMVDSLTGEDWHVPESILSATSTVGIQRSELPRLLGVLAHYHMIYVAPDPLTDGDAHS